MLLVGACGETQQQHAPGSAGSTGTTGGAGGTLAEGGTAMVAGASAAGRSSDAGSNEGGTSSAGAEPGHAGQAGSGGAPPCVPEAHERPAPGVLTATFSSLIGDFVGVYEIDDVYEQASDCTSMCRIGSSISPKFRPFPYLRVTSGSSERYDVFACQSPEDCTSPNGVRARLGAVDGAKSDKILFSELTYVTSPQGQTCTGGREDTWLIATAPTKIRVDLEEVRVEFPAYFSDVSGLYGCASEDATAAALNQPCNLLTVVDATRIQ